MPGKRPARKKAEAKTERPAAKPKKPTTSKQPPKAEVTAGGEAADNRKAGSSVPKVPRKK